ncbi:AAA family ATPase [Pseudomonas sp. CFBP 13727]|uniref:AAA family ATPase n=1 Tax=Pseudomonas sp. CFBP 13727 TaxID=2775295 RepID=UPI00177F2218|nr:AAA family ATPase [Pseudomonas sp. CFBP 13727]MBD8623421.1 AAA family ATPase [Pseudomonas sp. CFBP 13727]
MNNSAIKFLSVEIRNFRGVPKVLKIPLDARLTIIHAANGTGKSTICYALEWLLTNKVNDLPTTTDFSCEWGSGDTAVHVECEINGVRYELERIKGKAWIKAATDKKMRQIKDPDLLGMLTPTSVSGGTAQATSKARRDWLRNSRWLYANSLALLVDNSESATRQQIFADILGLGHLASTLSNLKEYRNELPKTQGLETKLKSVLANIEILEARLAQSQQGRDQAIPKLNAVLSGFPDSQLSGNVLDDFKNAQLKVAKLLQATRQQKEVLNLLLEGWAGYESSQELLLTTRKQLKETIDTSETLSKEHLKLSGQLSEVDVSIGQAKLGVGWAQSQTALLEQWDSVAKNPIVAQTNHDAVNFFKAVEDEFVEYRWEDSRQQGWLSALEYLIDNKDNLLSLLKQRSDLLRSPVLPPADLVQISKSANDAKREREKAQSEFDALSNVVDRLRALGHEAAQNLITGHCPLCSHDWGNAETLRQHLTYAAITPEIQAAKTKLETAQKTDNLWNGTLKTARSQQKSATDYADQLESVRKRLKAIESKTNYLSTMGKEDFADSDVIHFEGLRGRVIVAIGTKKVARSLLEVEDFFQVQASPNAITRVLEARQRLAQYSQHYQRQLDTETLQRTNLARSVGEKLRAIQAKAQESNQLNASIAAVSQVVSHFQAEWNQVNDGHPISKELYAATLARVEAELIRAEGYESQITECQVLLSVDDDSGKLSELQKEKAAVSKKLQTGQNYILTADEAISRYGEHVRNVTVSCLSPLLTPATELFSRMHANEVYHKLSVSGDDLNWMVLAEGNDTPLAAQEKLSQGQRQDLALSLYLSRAKSTGGSFLLDEPIAHLDDLNRVAMLDIFRLVATSMDNMNLILTTASDTLARHLAQKFSSLPDEYLLNTIHLEGNPRTGVKATVTRNTSTAPA